MIVLTGSLPVLPEAFAKQLATGGRLFAIVGDAPVMRANVYVKGEDGKLASRTIFDTVVRPLKNALQPERFVF